MITSFLPQFFFVVLPGDSFQTKIFMAGERDVADQMLVGQHLSPEGE